MTDKKISQLTGATTPLGGTEEVPLVQSSTTKKVSVDNLTKGRVVNALTFDTDVAAAGVTLTGTTLAADGTDTNIDINLTPKGTGEVNITKVDIDGGAIDGTAIGVNSKASGAFTTLETSEDIDVGNGKNISLNAGSSGSTTRLQWKYTGTPYAWIERVNSTGDMAFGVQSSEAMRLTSTLLQISKNDRANGAVLRITNSAESSAWVSGDVIGDIDFYSSDSSDPDVRSRIRSVSSTVGPNTNPSDVDLTFSTFASSTLTERMRLDASGRLLVGLTSSSNGGALQVDANGSGSTVYSGLIRNSNTSTSAYNAVQFTQGASGSATGVIGTGGSATANTAFANNFVIGTQTSNPLAFVTNDTERARVTDAGNFLVATTNTSATTGAGFKLLPGTNPRLAIVTGSSTSDTSISLYSTGAGAYRFLVDPSGTIYATVTTISSISDQRYKENIRDLDVGLDAVMALKPRKFDWKEGKGKDRKDDRGFIAQEFEQVFPDLVDEWKDPAPEGEEPYKSVRQDLIPVLVKAIQELKLELDAAKAKIVALEAK